MVSPGDFIQATDSHTCMGGCNNALAWGVGVTEYANLVYSGFTFVEVPAAIRFELVGELRDNVTAKDVMLYAPHAGRSSRRTTRPGRGSSATDQVRILPRCERSR